ncbi:DUF6000 family protein [Amycolatopsis rhabdoformis]|uniref:DUF6000 family protein n=1 Tax=Amycolatopsis rhabdoformis TaxID=1448059 RepID=A0ABZ1INJ1_9PSEU|nr:DUF6000 family protein [Amycolatopsis rhabdoformis]WSE35029.1 DUF6000 family protein [Amycolatopsis rhabdoformis]
MRNHRDDPELGAVVDKYVTPGRRYFELDHTPFQDDPVLLQTLGRGLAEDAVRITDEDLGLLLGYEWRAQLTASWLIAFDRRIAHRERIGELLPANERIYAGRGFCFALARFGTEEDALLLVAYLQAFLSRTDRGEQDSAMGALSYLDEQLGTDHAAQFLGETGAWAPWLRERFAPPRADPSPTLEYFRDVIATRCAYAEQSMKSLSPRH